MSVSAGSLRMSPASTAASLPNRKYFELFAPKPDAKAKQPGPFARTLGFGPWCALAKAGDLVGLTDALKASFPDGWERIMAMALHAIGAESSVAQDFPYWAFANYCGIGAPVTSGEISELYKSITADGCSGIATFMELFRENYMGRMKCDKECVVGFDSTNQNTSSGGMAFAEYGHPKKKTGLPDISTALFVDETTGIPLYYEHFAGSILDKTETPYTLERAEGLGFRKLFLMMDRGYFSGTAIKALSEMRFGVMCPDTVSLVDDMIAAYAATITDNEKHYIADEDAYGIHVPDTKVCGGSYDAYLFYDGTRAAQEKDSIHKKVNFLIKKAKQRKRYSEKLRAAYEPCLRITRTEKDPETGRNFTVQFNPAVSQPLISKAGYFVIVSNAGYDARTMLKIARERDCDEKDFRRIKTHFGFDSPYTHCMETYEGKAFTVFVALVMCESFRWFCRPFLHSCSSITTATALGELAKYQITTTKSGEWRPVYAMTAKQKELFGSLGLTSEEVEKEARSVTLRV